IRNTASATGAIPAEAHRRKLVLASLVVFSSLAALGLGVYQWLLSAQTPFHDFGIVRLTTTGKAAKAAISPDGRYVAYVLSDNGKESLWIRQVATLSAIQISPPTESHYEGLTFSRDGDFLYCVRSVNGVGILTEIPALGGPMKTVITGVDSAVALSPD